MMAEQMQGNVMSVGGGAEDDAVQAVEDCKERNLNERMSCPSFSSSSSSAFSYASRSTSCIILS